MLPAVPYDQYFSLLDTDQIENVTKIYKKVDLLVVDHVVSVMPIDGCIASDGNCMYASALAAAQRDGLAQEINVEILRERVAQRIVTQLGIYEGLLESQLLDLASEEMELGTNLEFLAFIREIRSIASDERQAYIQNNNLVNRYINLIEQNGVWGGDVELGVIGQVLDIQIDVHDIDAQTFTAINNDEQHSHSISISFAGNHYNTIEGYNIVLNDFKDG